MTKIEFSSHLPVLLLLNFLSGYSSPSALDQPYSVLLADGNSLGCPG